MTQNEMVLEYLKTHDDITQFDAFVHIGWALGFSI